jgi:hypothetical protein
MSAPENRCWLVKLAFERVQTYLFAVARLKAMIGGNTLMGEVLRGRLGAGGFEGQSLPALTGGHACLPNSAQAVLADLPGQDPQDPLQGHDRDDPRAAYERGVLVRDGGHLHAVFAHAQEAHDFVLAARRLVARELPGLPLSAHVVELTRTEAGWQEPERQQEQVPAGEATLVDLPQLQVCQEVGHGPASTVRRRAEGSTYVSASVHAREEAAERFDAGRSHDVLGLLRPALLQAMNLDPAQHRPPTEFEDVAPSGYLAVIAADGNGVGGRSTAWRGTSARADFFAREAHGEQFFHAMRRAVRRAFVAAIGATFRPLGGGLLPFRPMMLGGDDLLLVCDAPDALPFVCAYARQLSGQPLPDERGPLEVGIGVAVVKSTFPFHHAHALAEQLQASGKRLWRERPEVGSVLDWVALSESWHDDVAGVRRAQFLRRYRLGGNGPVETLLLTGKPYPVLGPGLTLETILQAAEQAAARGLPRGQLMALAEGLEHGRRQAEHAVRLLAPDVRALLRPILAEPSFSPWHAVGEGYWKSALLDFLEVFELERVRRARVQGKEQEAGHA